MSIDDFELSKQRIKKPFNQAGRVEIYNQLKNRSSSTVELRQLETRVCDVRTKVRSHYTKNRNQWVNQEIDRITSERYKPSGDAYQPTGWLRSDAQKNTDLDAIRHTAERHVESRHQQRMGRVSNGYDRMVKNIITQSREREGRSR